MLVAHVGHAGSNSQRREKRWWTLGGLRKRQIRHEKSGRKAMHEATRGLVEWGAKMEHRIPVGGEK